MNVDQIVEAWDADQPKYNRLGKTVTKFLRSSLLELEMYPEVSYRTKDLLSIIRKIKKKKLNKPYSYGDLKDKLGVRIICSFSEEMNIIDDLILKNFVVHKADRKKEALDHNRLDYISNHYDISIDAENKYFKKYKLPTDLIFELQVRTLNQHAWSNTSHALSYKQEANISDGLKRRVFRLLSLYEIADDEFSHVNEALRNQEDNFIYTVLRKTEGKIYKYAKTDFDREVSLYVLSKLLTYLDAAQLTEITRNIESFIAANEAKIKRIFKENANMLHRLPFLAQPEIFVIWYALEKFPFSLTDNWESDFELEELEDISGLWGRLIS